MAKPSCERCVENKKELVDHASCPHFPGDRDRSTFETYAAICRNYEEDKVCGARCPGYPRTCSRENGHEGPHRDRNALYNSDQYITVEWGKSTYPRLRVRRLSPKSETRSNNA